MSVALNTEIDWLECYLDFLLLYMSKSLVVIWVEEHHRSKFEGPDDQFNYVNIELGDHGTPREQGNIE